MNEIIKLRNQFDDMQHQYAMQIKQIIQSQLYKLDKEINVVCYSNDISKITIKYKDFNFEFNYYYLNDGGLYLRGYGKSNQHGYRYDRYSEHEQKEREKAYEYVRKTLKDILE